MPLPPTLTVALTVALALALALTAALALACQWGGICLVFAGLLLDVASKFLPGKKAAPKKEMEMSQVKGEGKAKRTSKAD